jgi:hypothetical protein
MIRKFVFKILLFALPLLAFVLYAEIGLSFIPTSYSVLQKNFYLYQKKVEVLIVGNSESQLGVAPKYFQSYKGYNLSNVSQPIYVSSKLVMNNLEKMDSLKMVVFSVGPISFFGTTKGHTEQWREKFYYHYWGLEPEYGDVKYTWNFKTGIYNFKTIASYALQGFYNIPVPYIDNIDTTGWERGYLENSDELLTPEVGKEIAEIHLSNVEFGYNRKNMGYIIDLNKALKEKGVKLILIQIPKSKYYIDNIPAELVMRNDQLLDSLYAAEGIPYYNFRDNPQFKDSDFRDVNHLNYIGAKKFSIMLSHIVDENLN